MVTFDFHVLTPLNQLFVTWQVSIMGKRILCLEIQKVKGYPIIFAILCKYLLKLDKALNSKSAGKIFWYK